MLSLCSRHYHAKVVNNNNSVIVLCYTKAFSFFFSKSLRFHSSRSSSFSSQCLTSKKNAAIYVRVCQSLLHLPCALCYPLCDCQQYKNNVRVGRQSDNRRTTALLFNTQFVICEIRRNNLRFHNRRLCLALLCGDIEKLNAFANAHCVVFLMFRRQC